MKDNKYKNSIYNIIKSVFQILFPVITFPYITRVLQKENLGKINFSQSIVNYITLLASLGFTSYAIRETSKVRDNKKMLSKVASELFSFNIMTTIFAYGILFIALLIYKPLYNYITIILIQSVTIIFTTLGADWLNTTMEDLKYITLRSIFFQLLSVVLMFCFVKNERDVINYVIIMTIASCGANILNIWHRNKFCNLYFTYSIDFKKIIIPVLIMFSTSFAQIIYVNSDMTILGIYEGDADVGLYSVAVKIYNIVNVIVASIAMVVLPQMSSAYAKKNYNKINTVSSFALNFILVLGLPIIVGIICIAEDLVYLIAGNGYEQSALVLKILSIALLFSYLGGFIGNIIFMASGREMISLFACTICAIVNIILNIVFIPKYGMYAAAVTTAIAEFVAFVISFICLEKNVKIINLPKMLKAPLIGCIMIFLVTSLTRIFIIEQMHRAIISFAFSVIVYIFTLYILGDNFLFNYINQFILRKDIK